MALHLVGKKGNRIPPVTNQSPRGWSSLCVDVNRPYRLSSGRTAQLQVSLRLGDYSLILRYVLLSMPFSWLLSFRPGRE